MLSLAHDAVVARLIDFSIWTHGPAPLPWAWLDMGSAARREFTLASDQDNALAYARPAPGSELTPEGVDAYFARLGADANTGLERCGIGIDNNGVMAGNRRWRMSKPEWLRTFDECLTEPDESHLVRASVAFDFRPAAGGLAVVAELTARIRAAREHPQFMRLMARAASGFPVALGFRGQLSTDSDGHLDIKRGAIIPVVNLVRYHALSAGVTISPTLDRIEGVAMAGRLAPDEAEALGEAFEVITRARFEHHAQLIADGRPADNLVDPGTLTPIARTDLREALHTVRRAQKRLAVNSVTQSKHPWPRCGAERHISGRKCARRTPLERVRAGSTLHGHVRHCGALHQDRCAAIAAGVSPRARCSGSCPIAGPTAPASPSTGIPPRMGGARSRCTRPPPSLTGPTWPTRSPSSSATRR